MSPKHQCHQRLAKQQSFVVLCTVVPTLLPPLPPRADHIVQHDSAELVSNKAAARNNKCVICLLLLGVLERHTNRNSGLFRTRELLYTTCTLVYYFGSVAAVLDIGIPWPDILYHVRTYTTTLPSVLQVRPSSTHSLIKPTDAPGRPAVRYDSPILEVYELFWGHHHFSHGRPRFCPWPWPGLGPPSPLLETGHHVSHSHKLPALARS